MLQILKRKHFTDGLILVSVIAIYLVVVNFTSPQNMALLGSGFHPFLIASIIYSAYYGTKHALVSSVVFTLVYFTLLYFQVDFQEVESLFLRKFLMVPIHIFFMSILVGEIRQRTWNHHVKTREALKRTDSILNALKKKTEASEKELTELQKRYATLTYSFEDNLRIFERLEGKPLKEVVEVCNEYFFEECQAGIVGFVYGDMSNANSDEKELLGKLERKDEIYSLRDDLLKSESERILTHMGAEMIVPLVVNNKFLGWFLLGDFPFLALNIYNQKRIENMIRLASVSLRNYGRKKEWEADSPLLSPFNIYKENAFFEELKSFYNSLATYKKRSEEKLFYLKFDLTFSPSVLQSQKENVYMVLSHLAKTERHGAAPVGGNSDLTTLYYAFVEIPTESKARAEKFVSQFNSLIPEDSKLIQAVSLEVINYSGNDQKRLKSV